MSSERPGGALPVPHLLWLAEGIGSEVMQLLTQRLRFDHWLPVILWKKNIGNIWENMEHMENIIDIYIYMETSGDKYGNIF